MKNSGRSLLIGSLIMLVTVTTGISGYLFAGWTFIDALFMVVITIFGVGYGEVRNEGPGLRLFTIGIILAGCTSLIYLIGGFIQFLTEGEIQRVLGIRRMNAEIEKLKSHVIICGYGRIGRILAADLEKAGCKFVIVEAEEERVAEADAKKYLVCKGDGTEEGTLNRVGVERARVLATVLPNDASNVFITLTARNLNPKLEIIARGETPSTEGKLFQAGATRVILPAHIGAERIAHQILHPSTENLLSNNVALKNLDAQLGSLGIHIEEIEIPENSDLIGSSLSDVETRSRAQFLVVAIHRAEGQDIVHPRPDTVIQAGDHLIFVCHSNAVVDFTGPKQVRRNVIYRGARHTS
jgi:voltage-gated potassium channel